MTTNPQLFPNQYSDLCPGTQIAETDRLDELERRLQVLRYQHLMGLKKDGQSIAELQNAGLTVANQLYPAVSVGRSFLGGGAAFGIHGQIDRFTHATEGINTLDFRLTTARCRHAGTSSSAKGYWAGGETVANVTKTNNIEALVFLGETKAAVSSTLTAATAYFRGTYSQTKGYFGGQYNSNSGKIEALVFSSEAVSALGATLPSVVGGCNATQSSDKAYFCSGWNFSTAINSLAFATETTAALSATLSSVRVIGGNFASNSKGYFSSGLVSQSPLTFTRTVDALTFATEAIAIVANALTTIADADQDGAGAIRKGYTWGGYLDSRSSKHIDGLEFASEVMAKIGTVLSRGGPYVVPTGKP